VASMAMLFTNAPPGPLPVQTFTPASLLRLVKPNTERRTEQPNNTVDFVVIGHPSPSMCWRGSRCVVSPPRTLASRYAGQPSCPRLHSDPVNSSILTLSVLSISLLRRLYGCDACSSISGTQWPVLSNYGVPTQDPPNVVGAREPFGSIGKISTTG